MMDTSSIYQHARRVYNQVWYLIGAIAYSLYVVVYIVINVVKLTLWELLPQLYNYIIINNLNWTTQNDQSHVPVYL